MPGPLDGALKVGDFCLGRLQSRVDGIGTETCLLHAHEVEIVNSDKAEESLQEAFLVLGHLVGGIFAAPCRCDDDLAAAGQPFGPAFRIFERYDICWVKCLVIWGVKCGSISPYVLIFNTFSKKIHHSNQVFLKKSVLHC